MVLASRKWGRTVVVNLSRSAVVAARSRYAQCIAVAIAIEAATMRLRLVARGRESAPDIETRITRLDFSPPEGFDQLIDNTGLLEGAAQRLHTVIAPHHSILP